MKNIMKLASIALVLLFTLFGLTNKASAAKLTLYCSVEIDVCEMLEQAYEKETGTKVSPLLALVIATLVPVSFS